MKCVSCKNLNLKMKINLLLVIVLCALCSFTPPQHSSTSYITDLANVISPEDEARIQRALVSLREATKAQGAVLTVTTLDGLDKADYATRTFKAWGVGDATLNNGFLFLLCPQERKWWCTTGYGLEEGVWDGWIASELKPYLTKELKAGNLSEGMARGSEMICSRIMEGAAAGQVKTDPDKVKATDGEATANFLGIFGGILVIGGLCFFIGYTVRKKWRREREEQERLVNVARLKTKISDSVGDIRTKRGKFETAASMLPEGPRRHYISLYEMCEAEIRDDRFNPEKITEIDPEKYYAALQAMAFDIAKQAEKADSYIEACDTMRKKIEVVKAFNVDSVRNHFTSVRASANRAQNVANDIESKWPNRAASFGNIGAQLTTMVGHAEAHINQFNALVLAQRFDEAVPVMDKLKEFMKKASAVVQAPENMLSSLTLAINNAPRASTACTTAKLEAYKKGNAYKGNDSSFKWAKNDLEVLDRKFASLVNSDPIIYIEALESIKEAYDVLARKFSKLEDDRLRKIREEKERQERAKREEEEEEERRRRRNYESISIGGGSLFDSGGSGGSSSDSGSSFGGGDSGGGGGGGDY